MEKAWKTWILSILGDGKVTDLRFLFKEIISFIYYEL